MTPNAVIMIRPTAFGFNAQTASSNAFQNKMTIFSPQQVQDIALLEFDNMVSVLIKAGIEVSVFDDIPNSQTPDSIFPNNWFSTFTGELILYPMKNENRRQERRPNLFNGLSAKFEKPNEILLAWESKEEYLEGTGSLVCDYASCTAFAAISPRTSENALTEFEKITGYSSVRFTAMGPDNTPIYHTNVMMTMGDTFAIIGADTIIDSEREAVIKSLEQLGKDPILLSNEQVFDHFAGNMLHLKNNNGEKFLVMSSSAFYSLTESQKEQIEKHNTHLLHVPIHLIEKIGGGSARCMMAELFH